MIQWEEFFKTFSKKFAERASYGKSREDFTTFPTGNSHPGCLEGISYVLLRPPVPQPLSPQKERKLIGRHYPDPLSEMLALLIRIQSPVYLCDLNSPDCHISSWPCRMNRNGILAGFQIGKYSGICG